MSIRRFILGLLLFAVIATGYMYSVAVRDPVIRRASIAMPDWPDGADPLTVMLISDVHVASPDMPPERLTKIVASINKAQPDLVVFAGDFVSDKRLATRVYVGDTALAPLRGLTAKLGAVAVLGNHDHWRGTAEMKAALRSANVTVLTNEAVAAGPLVIGGVDDDFTSRADVAGTLVAMHKLGQADATDTHAFVMLSHSPDIMPNIPGKHSAGFIPLLLAGHTHCGQIVLPFWGPVSSVSRFGLRYNCGIIREDGKMLVVGAGLGTSILPLRLGAVPDMWLLKLGPSAKP